MMLFYTFFIILYKNEKSKHIGTCSVLALM